MKKFYSLVFALVTVIGFTNAQCTINPNDTALFNPDPNNVPCAQVGVPYDETLLFYVPVSQDITIAGFAVTVYVDSVVLNNVTGLPAGLTWTGNPAGPVYMPGTHGCGRTSGTTNAATGDYPISFDGLMYMHGSLFTFSLDTALAIDQVIQNQYGKTFSINVGCTSGINDFNAELSSALSVLPNPNNGQFTVSVNAASRVSGEMVVVDITGRTVYSQRLDVAGLYNTTLDLTKYSKGLYTVQLRTANGVASKKISIQ